MNTSDHRTRLAQKLLALAQGTAAAKHSAYLLAGWAALFGLLPRITCHQRVTLNIQLLGYGLLLLWLVWLAGPMLNSAQPIFQAMGRIPGELLLSLIFGGFNLRRYFVGRRLLNFIDAHQKVMTCLS